VINKGDELMANPSLKAQIEAAKSALASDLVAPSLVTPPPKPPLTPMKPNFAGNNIAADNGTNDTGGIPADGKSAHATNAAALDERITRLETKLLDNQRDLHTLLQKIREISRLQTNSGKSRKNRAKDQAETMTNDETKAEPRQSQRSPLVMVAMAILIGLVVGIAYFLVTAKGDLSALTVPSWVRTIIDRFNGLIG
jgi:DNA polymerase III gamma/tau subunit